MILHEKIFVNINEVGPQLDALAVRAVKGTKVVMLGQMQQQCRHKANTNRIRDAKLQICGVFD